MKWKVTVVVMAYSTGRGADADRKAAGNREQSTVVECDTIRHALRFADAFVNGIKTNPAVWEVQVYAIERIGE